METGQADCAYYPPKLLELPHIAKPSRFRLPALTIQCDAGIGVPKLICGHTGIVAIILL